MKQNIRRILAVTLLLTSAATGGYSGFQLWQYHHDYLADRRLYEELRSAVTHRTGSDPDFDTGKPMRLETEEFTFEITDEITDEIAEGFIKEESFAFNTEGNREMVSWQAPFAIDWHTLQSVNQDIIGWVYFTGLPQISYPILQAEDNAYYVNRTYDLSSENSKAGSIFMDYRMENDFSSPYSIIYGHNVRDGSMFSDLILLKDQKLYDAAPYFWIMTPQGAYRYRIFSIFQCHRSADVFQQSFQRRDKAFIQWYHTLQLRNEMIDSQRLEECSHIIVFSTCVPESYDRTIVCGYYVDGDSIPDPHT